MIIIYVTCKDIEEAQKISQTLLGKKLVACANFFPIKSMYWWQDSISKDNEIALILKTRKEKFKEVEQEVKKLHSYERPCIITLDINGGSKEFLEWIKKEVKD